MARWSEHALAKDGLGEVKYSPKGPWPQKLQHQKILVGMKYPTAEKCFAIDLVDVFTCCAFRC